MIYGKSGSGKSRSMKNFSKDEIVLFNTIGKELPFRSKFDYEITTDSYAKIISGLKKMPCKIAVIDDAGYLQTNDFMRGHSEPKKGASTFDLFNQIADDFWGLLMFIKTDLPKDVVVYILMHELSNDSGEIKIRTIGKLLDEKVCLEGMCTVVLHCMTDGKKHYFKTQSSGNDVSKSPEGMFDAGEIDNDLKMVDEKIREYWELKGEKDNEKA